MKSLLKNYDIELSEKELKNFEKFLEIFKEKNSQINLSAIREDSAIIEKHFIDSIMLNVFLDFTSLEPSHLRGEGVVTKIRIADMGTGGGFPGIPLAIVNPEAQFVLMDSVGKKLKAVDEFVQNLDLKNIKTLNARAEDIGQDLKYRENFDLVVSRATAYFPTLLEYTIPLLKVGAIFVAYKLDDKEEIKSAKKALSRLSAKIVKIKNYTIDGQKRTFIFIEKLAPTHKKYPRKIGVPLKEPIK